MGSDGPALTTTDRSKVDVPDWASDIEIGDVIRWSAAGESGVKEVVGFSTSPTEWGLPVIDVPGELPDEKTEGMETIAVQEQFYLGMDDDTSHVFEFKFYTEHKETVVVEADHPDEAREAAEAQREYRGELQQTTHVERREV